MWLFMTLGKVISDKTKKFQLVKGKAEELFILSLGELIEKVPLGMSEIQIERFVLNDIDFPTDWGKFKQAKRELWARFEAIVNMMFDYEKTEAEIELLEAQIQKLKRSSDPEDVAKIRIKRVEIEQKKFRLQVIRKMIDEKIREAKVFYRIYEKFKDFDSMDEEKIKELELEFWKQKEKYDPTGRLKAYLRGL